MARIREHRRTERLGASEHVQDKRVIAKADLRLDATSAAWAMVSGVRAHQGVGVARLAVDLDVSPRINDVAGGLLSTLARVRVAVPGLQNYLCDLLPVRQYIEVPERGGSITVSLEGPIGMRQLKLIEQYRTGDVTLTLELNGHWVIGERHIPFWGVTVDAEIEHSAWVKFLSGWGYRNVLLLEFDQPTTARTKEFEQAFGYLAEARDRFLQHEARHTVESLRQCLASLVGKKPEDEDSAVDVTEALRVARKDARPGSAVAVDYDRRFELARMALKFAADLAAHPEAGKTTLVEAESLLIMTAGLLYRFGRPR